MLKTIEVLSGDPPSPALEDRVRELRQPLLMVSAGTAEEYEFSALYDRAGGPNVEHWNLPDASHTAAVRQAAARYEERVTDFFDRLPAGEVEQKNPYGPPAAGTFDPKVSAS